MQSLQSPAFLRKLFKHIHRQKFVCFFNIFILKEVGISNARNVAKINIAMPLYNSAWVACLEHQFCHTNLFIIIWQMRNFFENF